MKNKRLNKIFKQLKQNDESVEALDYNGEEAIYWEGSMDNKFIGTFSGILECVKAEIKSIVCGYSFSNEAISDNFLTDWDIDYSINCLQTMQTLVKMYREYKDNDEDVDSFIIELVISNIDGTMNVKLYENV